MAKTYVGSPGWRGTLRLYAAGERALEQSEAPAAQLAVEWQGNRHGHPSSYGLLAASLGDQHEETRFDFDFLEGARSFKALAGRAEIVELTLELPYRQVVVDHSREIGIPLVVTFAATGQQGSSQRVFEWLTAMLALGLHNGKWPTKKEEVWAMWDKSRPVDQRFVS